MARGAVIAPMPLPDCRRVRDDLRISGYYNIDYELQQLMEKLK